MDSPLHGCPAEDQSGARKMAGTGDHFGGRPAVSLHDAGGETGVLDGVFGPRLRNNDRSGDALGLEHAAHPISLVVPVVWAPGDDDVRGDAASILAHPFRETRKEHRTGVSIPIDGSAKHDNGVETRSGRISGWGKGTGEPRPNQNCNQ